MHIIKASTSSPILQPTGFSSYDFCMNPYVGCHFGCKFCYVRQRVIDKQHEWGEFVRVREHIKEVLPRQLDKLYDKKLVVGTMTDPYQPIEQKYNITRASLEILSAANLKHMSIFTRSILVTRDIDLIKSFPSSSVHISITPFDNETLRYFEPKTAEFDRRIQLVQDLSDAGVNVYVNAGPVMPAYSDYPELIKYTAKVVSNSGAKGLWIEPMDPYEKSSQSVLSNLPNDIRKDKLAVVLSDKSARKNWWRDVYKIWQAAWIQFGNPNMEAVFNDGNHGSIDLNTGKAN